MNKIDYLESLICQMIQTAGSGHYATSMSALEIMYPLFYEQGVTPDIFILSKGHAAPALYAILYDLGYLTDEDLQSFRKIGGLPGHPSIETPGVLCSSGSLGMGISKAIGLAYANPDKTYYVLVGDGELQEGQNWEAIQYILGNDVRNVIIHVDNNGMQYSGNCELDWRNPPDFMIIHKTTWHHDNSYLCTPKKRDDTYSRALLAAMKRDERIICLNADLEHDFGLTIIKESFPDRYIQCGISEQHMVSMAGGLARAGKLPVCHTFGSFYRRCIDQIYNNRCDRLNIGYVAGLINHGEVNIGKSHVSTAFGEMKLNGIELARNIDEFFKMLPDAGGIYLEV